MANDTWEEAASNELDKLGILNHVFERGPHTAQMLVAAGLVTNTDDAVAAMAKLVESHKARWTEIDGVKAVEALLGDDA